MRNDRLADDPVLQQVLLACPPLSAEELVPTSERATAILQRVLEAEVPESRRRRNGSPRALFAVALPLLAVTAVVLLIAGVFSGPGGSGAQPALAAVIRHIEQSIAVKPGTIVVSVERTICRGGCSSPTAGAESVLETPSGAGPQDQLHILFVHTAGTPTQTALIGGEQEFYLRKTNTVYVSSIWGHNITKGTRPGTFIYTPPKQPGQGARPAKPLRLTAAQAHALLDGSDMIQPDVRLSPRPHVVLRLLRVSRIPSWNQGIRPLIRSHGFRIGGLTTVDGRRAIELVGQAPAHVGDITHASITFWVDPKTYVPIKEVYGRPGFFHATTTWLEYKTLPITPTNQRLLSLIALHPHARVDRNYNDYLKAANGYEVFSF